MTDQGPGRQILQRVVFGFGDGRAAPLYLRPGDEPGSWATDTYFNVFHRRRWAELTGLADFSLLLTARGSGRLVIDGLSVGPDGAMAVVSRVHALAADRDRDYAFDLTDCPGEFIAFSWTAGAGQTLEMVRAGYAAPATGRERAVRLAVVVTTYNRNRELSELVATYTGARARHPDLLGCTELFVVNNAPGNDLSALARDGVVRVYANPRNFGGAGGFARGAREAAGLGGYTHAVFMDDDVTVDPETWLRTVTLLRNLKEEHAGDLVSGAMFTAELPTYCHTAREGLDARGNRQPLAGGVEVTSLASVAALTRDSSEARVCHAYAAWWYCAIPMTVFARHGFPLPYFFRGDDQEFGLRAGRAVRQLNGICVWHPDFGAKKSALRTYCGARNYVLTQLLHFAAWKHNVHDFFWKHVARDLAVGDYETCAAHVLALHDALHFETVPRSGEELIPRVTRGCASYANTSGPSTGERSSNSRGTWSGRAAWCRFVIFCSLGGALLPSQLLQVTGCFFVQHQQGARRLDACMKHDENAVKYVFSRKLAFVLATRAVWLLVCLVVWPGRKVRGDLVAAMGMNTQPE
jgi:GT2 family glycosyltransferase